MSENEVEVPSENIAPEPPKQQPAPIDPDDLFMQRLNGIARAAHQLVSAVGDVRCQAIAKTKLEEFTMWSTRGVLLARQARASQETTGV